MNTKKKKNEYSRTPVGNLEMNTFGIRDDSDVNVALCEGILHMLKFRHQ